MCMQYIFIIRFLRTYVHTHTHMYTQANKDLRTYRYTHTQNTHTHTHTHILTYSMVQSPSWEANWFAASQEIPHISRNSKVHYRTHKRPPPVPILGQPNPVHIPTSHLLEIHPNIIHPSTPRSPQWSLSLQFPHQDPIHPLSSPIRAKRVYQLFGWEFSSSCFQTGIAKRVYQSENAKRKTLNRIANVIPQTIWKNRI